MRWQKDCSHGHGTSHFAWSQKHRICRQLSKKNDIWGILDTLKKYDLDVVPDYVIETDQTEKEGFEAMEKLLRSDDCPTGIYCANDITAVGMLKYLGRCRNLYFTPS